MAQRLRLKEKEVYCHVCKSHKGHEVGCPVGFEIVLKKLGEK